MRLNAEGRDAIALSTLTARLGEAVSFDTLNAVVGGGISRHQVFLTFAGDRSMARINGATMIKGRQHADIDARGRPCGASLRRAASCSRRSIDGEATGVFQGKIIVEPHAQKTDGRMMSAALLLSEGGTMNNKPELEIFADDVQCAHGATCGQLDEDLLFYLMARGAAAGRGREPAGSGLPGRGDRGGGARGRARGARRHRRGVVEGALLTSASRRGTGAKRKSDGDGPANGSVEAHPDP